jgi:uncharacterized protein YndB with AHSA1/START domain
MPTNRSMRFEIDIAAPRRRVFDLLIEPQACRDWTSPFAEGSYYEGDRVAGGTIRFMSPSGDGMLSEIVDHRPSEYTSIPTSA